jgi:hypothetical protein
MNNVGQQVSQQGQQVPLPWYRNPAFTESNWVSVGTKWFLTFGGKIARIVLIATTLYMSAEMYPGVHLPSALNLAAFIVLSFALDMGGLGLAQIAKKARESGNIEGADAGENLSKWLINIMIAGLVVVSLENAATTITFLKPYQDGLSVLWLVIDISLTIARVVCAVKYGHVLNDLERSIEGSQAIQVQATQTRDQQLDALHEEVNQLKGMVTGQQKAVVDYDQIVTTILPHLPSSILPENIVSPEEIQKIEARILSQFNDKNNEVISLINTLINNGGILQRISDEITGEIEKDILTDIPEANKHGINEDIPAQIVPKKARELSQEKELPWDDIIAKFPMVIEWRSAGLRSVTREQIIEATNFSKNKVGRVKFSQVKGGNKRIESVLNWLKNETPNNVVEKPANTQPLNQEIMPEITGEIAEELDSAIVEELEEVITPQKTRNTVPLFLSDLPHELREDNVVSEEEFERRKAHALKVEKDWESGAYDAPLSDVVDEGIEFAKRYLKGRRTTVNTDPEIIAIGE